MNIYPMEKEQAFEKEIAEIRKQLQKSNSFGGNFLRGILWGLGSAVGASTIAAIVIATWAHIFHSLKDLTRLFN